MLGIGIIGVLLISALAYLPNLDNQNLHRFELSSLDVSGDGSFIIEDRLCFAKVTNQATVGGEIFDRDESPFGIGHPSLQSLEFFAGDAVNIIDGFIITPKITCIGAIGSSVDLSLPTSEQIAFIQEKIKACKLDKAGENCDASNFNVMVFQPSELSVSVISEDNIKGEKITTYIDTITTNLVEATGGTEVELASFTIPVTDLEDDLSGGTYSSIQEFRISGTIIMNPKVCSSCVYTYYIPEEAIPTFHEIIVKKAEGDIVTIDSDGDGVPDTNESGKQNDALAQESEKQNTKLKSSTETIEGIAEFGDCLIVQDVECLNQGKFALLWFVVAGIIGIGFIGFVFSLIMRKRNN